ncbi:hypothetical protein Zmor_017438 [Zophobas morio]|uniref:Uncharacterized protein n=1 Tax=Zophobas morio TaxID=2755281 RepID=A0AA38I8T6_9CUCU|nr:hypothetical protein Zmor_017438 [Zophobas morio]
MDVYQISSNESRLIDKSLRDDIGLRALWSADQTSSQAKTSCSSNTLFKNSKYYKSASADVGLFFDAFQNLFFSLQYSVGTITATIVSLGLVGTMISGTDTCRFFGSQC